MLMQRQPSVRLCYGLAMIVAPLLQAASTFFWEGSNQSVIGGTLIVLATIFWLLTFVALFDLLREKMPLYAAWGQIPAFYGCIGGALFGFRDVYAATFHFTRQVELQAFSAHALSYNFTLFWSGPFFVLSLLALSFFLTWKRVIPWWIGALLFLGALTFPISRIPRIELIAHLADALLFLPLLFLGWKFLLGQSALFRSHKE